jgi:predicted cation transporter
MIIGLFAIIAAVLILPLLVKKVEEQLEIFLFVAGVIAVTVSAQWRWDLVKEALREPLSITAVVLAAGTIFKVLQRPLDRGVRKLREVLGPRVLIFLVVVFLGALSSVITAIVASLVLVELLRYVRFERKVEIRVTVIACFSIGLGASLTPIGEPLSTIAIAKLRGEPYHADFWFLARILGLYIAPCVIALGILALILVHRGASRDSVSEESVEESWGEVFLRTGKVYLFVMALVLLGTGLKPIIDTYVSRIPYLGLYWINSISAIVDNATLTAAEIGPSLELHQITAALLGMLISGGMLIPGNIPNIISAGKLKIGSRQWAAIGVPIGLAIMSIVFAVILLTR